MIIIGYPSAADTARADMLAKVGIVPGTIVRFKMPRMHGERSLQVYLGTASVPRGIAINIRCLDGDSIDIRAPVIACRESARAQGGASFGIERVLDQPTGYVHPKGFYQAGRSGLRAMPYAEWVSSVSMALQKLDQQEGVHPHAKYGVLFREELIHRFRQPKGDWHCVGCSKIHAGSPANQDHALCATCCPCADERPDALKKLRSCFCRICGSPYSKGAFPRMTCDNCRWFAFLRRE